MTRLAPFGPPSIRLTRGVMERWARAWEVSPRVEVALTTRLLVVRGSVWGSMYSVACTVAVSFRPRVTLNHQATVNSMEIHAV